MVVGTLKREKQTDRLFFALSDPTRRDIVTQTLDRERSVSQLGRRYPISLTAVRNISRSSSTPVWSQSTGADGNNSCAASSTNCASAHELLDELETVWRARLERFEDVLNETTGKEDE